MPIGGLRFQKGMAAIFCKVSVSINSVTVKTFDTELRYSDMKEIDYKKIGKRIKKLRDDKGLTQQELEDISGVDVRRISAIENGKSIRLDSLIWFAVALECSADYILFGTNVRNAMESCADIDELLAALYQIRDFLEYHRRNNV